MTEKEAIDLDEILRFSRKQPTKALSTEYLRKEILRNESEDYVKRLFYILVDNENCLLYPKGSIPTYDCFWANPNAEAFLIKGGFYQLYTLEKKQLLQDERKEGIEKFDLQIKKWQARTKWYPYVVSTCALLFSIGTFFYNKKETKELESLEESIQLLELKVKEIDSLTQNNLHIKRDSLQ